MPKVKIARKSTWVDMTAFVDVAFLILSFFMLATKFKPDEAVPIKTPSSVSSDKIAEKNNATILIDSTGKVYLQILDKDTKQTVLDNVIATRGYQLTEAQRKKMMLENNIGSSFETFQRDYATDELKPAAWTGIPTDNDSIGGQLNLWIRDVVITNDSIQWYVKADGTTKYPAFRNVLKALKANNQNKFLLITNPEEVPSGTALDKINSLKEKAAASKAN